MCNRECQIIQDLLPLYADGESSEASTAMVERHLARCADCSAALELYRRPVLADPVTQESGVKGKEGFVSHRIWRLGVILATCFLITVSTIAWASYHTGRNLALRDPSFHTAEELDLFTEVNQSRKLGPHVLTLDKILLDTSRTTLVYRVKPALPGGMLNIEMNDDKGTIYDPRGGRGLQGKYFIYDLEPANLDANRLILSFTAEEIPERELYPGTKATTGSVEFTLEQFVLGLSESAFHFRVRWPMEPEIAGLGIGEDRPMYTVMGLNGPTGVEGRGSRPHSIPSDKGAARFIPDCWTQLVDVTNGQRIKLVKNRLQTDTITGGIRGTFFFEPAEQSATEFELKTPPFYLYRFPAEEQVLELACPVEGEKYQ